VVALNRAAHQRLEHGGEQTLEILNMCDAHLVLSEGLDGELALAGEKPIGAQVAAPDEASVWRDFQEPRLDVEVGSSRQGQGKRERAPLAKVS
jgi:hypothetical protein